MIKAPIIQTLMVVAMVWISSVPANALQSPEQPFTTTRYALALSGGQTYSPTNEIQFFQASAVALYDYDRIWPHRAPEPLRFKVEGSAGLASTPHCRAQLSLNMLALYFIDPLSTTTLRPYLEAGIGINYGDYQVDGQGLRVNFNPLVGIGSEIKTQDESIWFVTCRLHHISNGGFHSDNRGMNSAVIQIGRFF